MSALALITGAYGVLRPFIILTIKTRQGDIQDSWWLPAAAQAQGPTGTLWVGPAHLAGREPRPSIQEAGLLGLCSALCPPGLLCPWGSDPLKPWPQPTPRALGVATVTVHFITIFKHLFFLQGVFGNPFSCTYFLLIYVCV